MFDLDTWQEIFSTLRRNRLRTVLTALGVFWGIFMLLCMLTFGRSWTGGINNTFASSAVNAVFIWGERTTLAYDGLKPGRDVEFENSDVAAIRASIPGVEYLAPRVQ